jgi:hypothetical protein
MGGCVSDYAFTILYASFEIAVMVAQAIIMGGCVALACILTLKVI